MPTFLRSLLLLISVFAIYFPVWHGAPLWDDSSHVPDHRDSLYTLDGLRQIWAVPGYVQQYYPLMFSTVWIAHHLWGGNPLGYHLLTIFLHGCNALLIVWLLTDLEISAAWWAALLFAFHPVNVESVAWVSELKNTQSTFFYLLSLILLLRSIGREGQRTNGFLYSLALIFFAGALFSKTIACTVPATALILLWYRRGFWTHKDLLLLAPFVALGATLGILTAHWERTLIGAMGAAWTFSLDQRLTIATHAFWFYIGKLLVPHPLIFMYTRWIIGHGAAGILGSIGIFFLLAALFTIRRRTGRGPLAAVLIFGVVIAPALGFVNNYPMRYTFVADHYQYAASIALLTLIAAALWQWGRSPLRRVVFSMLCIFLAGMSWTRAHAFLNSETLWRDTLAKNPTCRMAHDNLAANYLSENDLAGARREEVEALRLPEPDDLNGDLVLGDLQLRYDGNPTAALQSFDRAYDAALRLPPSQTANVMMLSVYLYRSRAYAQAKRFDETRTESLRALELIQTLAARPLYNATAELLAAMEAEVRGRLAFVAEENHQWPEAIAQLQAALRATPQDVELELRLADDFAKNAQRQNAAEVYQQVLKLAPHSWVAHNWLGQWLEQQGHLDEAIAHDREAVMFNSDLKATHERLAKLLLKQGRKGEALEEYRAAIQATTKRNGG